MTLALLILLLSVPPLLVGLPVLEIVLLNLLSTPIFFFLLGKAIPAAADAPGITYAAIFAALSAFVLLLGRKNITPARLGLWREWLPVFILCGLYLIFCGFCLLWPDFIAMGERLRDYAILNEVIRSPIRPEEPWMAGEFLNYYVYWYRVGAMFSALLGWPTWKCYHFLQAFTYALYAACAFRLFFTYLKVPALYACAVTVFLALGSNVAGVIAFAKKDDNWWGPSRVIPGAINEFPAWSFLLGDLHPHYLNLGLMPLFILFVLALIQVSLSRILEITLLAAAGLGGSLWIYNANAWELPAWWGFLLLLAALCFFAARYGEPAFKKVTADIELSWQSLSLGLLFTACTCSLFWSLLYVNQESYPWNLVLAPIERSKLVDLMMHWGLPFSLITLCALAALPFVWLRIFAMAFVLVTFFTAAAPLVLILVACMCLVISLRATENETQHSTMRIVHAMGLTGIGLIILPEIIFMNDPYGGENERMNTIFKFYSAAWFLVHSYAFYLVYRLWTRQTFSDKLQGISRGLPHLFVCLVLFASCGFFYRTISLRKSTAPEVTPRIEGLSDVEAKFQGSAKVIRELRAAPRGITLEAQGNAYSHTTYVTTLAGQPAFLGWANHVNLLVRKQDETRRRETVTDSIYREQSCDRIQEIMRQENIRYLVVGVLERQKYPGLGLQQFSCLSPLANEGEMSIFQRAT